MAYKKNTICWQCANFNKCSWSKGKPVDGWTATKTRVKDENGEIVLSYEVLKCPEYEEDRIFMITYQELAEMLEVSFTSIFNMVRKREDLVNAKLFEKGYKLRRYLGDTGLYLERIDV